MDLGKRELQIVNLYRGRAGMWVVVVVGSWLEGPGIMDVLWHVWTYLVDELGKHLGLRRGRRRGVFLDQHVYSYAIGLDVL